MDPIRLDNIQIYDVNENDRYEAGIDLINTLQDKPLPSDGPEVKGLLQRLGIDSFQRIDSLHALSKHLGCLKAAEEMAAKGEIEGVRNKFHCAVRFALRANLSFQLDDGPLIKKAYQKRIEDIFLEAEEGANKGEPNRVKDLLKMIKFDGVQGGISFDEVRAEKIMRKAFSNRAEELLHKALDSNQKGQWASVAFFLKEAQSLAKVSGTGLSYPGTEEILDKAYRNLLTNCLEDAEKSSLGEDALQTMRDLEAAREWGEMLKLDLEEWNSRKGKILEKLSPQTIRKGLDGLYQRAEVRLQKKQYRVAEAEGLIELAQKYGEFFNIDPDSERGERILKIATQNEKKGKKR